MRKISILSVVLALACGVAMGQRGRGRGAPPPPPPAPMMDLANKVVDAVNKQDTMALQKLVTADAVYLDEDGHQPPVSAWIMRLTTGTPAKKMEVTGIRGQMWDDGGWFSFNYTLSENFKEKPVMIKGTASFVVKKNGPDWQITMVHGALEQHIAGMTQ
ncbi:MAG TPA: hypothetical protein VGK48_16760 [Terriglobia bacterium]